MELANLVHISRKQRAFIPYPLFMFRIFKFEAHFEPIRRYIERPSENLGCLRQLEKYYLIHDRIISKKLQLTKQGKEIPGELLDRGNAHVQTDSEPIHLKLEAFRFNLM
ncbi:hypothetical protein GQR58_016393 [Nymphon striatum]|nr:hypothetical protein GQR58_016393 [Nymphon striatum]